MKKKNIFATLALLGVLTLVGCGETTSTSQDSTSGSTSPSGSVTSTPSVVDSVSVAPGTEIYEKTLVYDTSKDAYSVAVKINSTLAVSAVACGRVKGVSGEFSNAQGVLTLAGSFLDQIASGEKTINVTLSDGGTTTVPALIATKVITTAQDFQDINKNLTGTYVLGNDIDLSSISNFEPLGFYYEETSTKNEYFHGILEGNGYSVKNGKVFYCSSTDSSQDVYEDSGLFSSPAHVNGDNIGLFQVIGSSGVVRNVVFDNIKVRGRTIVGVIAGNCMGVIQNCIVTETCKVQMGTHFYDNDCNCGLAVGIVAGSGQVSNVISLSSLISVPEVFTDYGDTYKGKIGNGWDHTSTPGNTDPTWKFANVDRPKMNYDGSGVASDSGTKEIDSNGHKSNGIYAFAGKVWGEISNSFALSFTITPYQGESRIADFAQTHLGSLKPTSGPDNLGTLNACGVKTLTELKVASLYSAFDTSIWTIKDGSLPKLVCPQIGVTVTE